MKKILIYIILLIAAVPVMVLAAVDANTQTEAWELETYSNAAALCSAEESKNVAAELSAGTTGYYLYCIKIDCVNGVNQHSSANPLNEKLTCANGNTNPYVSITSSAANGIELREGATCTSTGTYAYATENVLYNCSRVNDGSANGAIYTSNTNNNTSTNNGSETTATDTPGSTNTPGGTSSNLPGGEDNNSNEATSNNSSNSSNQTTESPDTGVEDYILPLAGAIILIGGLIYFINKKNIFKEI